MEGVRSFFGRNIYSPSTEATSTSASTATWTREHEKLFETGLVIYSEATQDRWIRIAERVPGKSNYEVFEHYKVLVHDIMEIEAGHVELPNYLDDYDRDTSFSEKLVAPLTTTHCGPTTTKTATERKRGIPWTEEEHRNFLLGLEEFSRGDWRSISRLYVKSRTPAQVASHAQKYFIHQDAKENKKARKRSSIHDTSLIVARDDDNNNNCLNAAGIVAHTQVMPKRDDFYRRDQGGVFPNIGDS